MNVTRKFLAIVLCMVAGSVMAQPLTYTPQSVTEEYESDIFDDDVDFRGAPIAPHTLEEGNALTWNQKYGSLYKVTSSDMADIDALTIFGNSTGPNNGRANVTVEVQLSDKEGNLVGQRYSSGTIGWGVGNLTISIDDVLGNLEGMIIGDFHLLMTVGESSTVEFTHALFNWEVGSIERVSTPGVLVLLLTGMCVFLYAGSNIKIRNIFIEPGFSKQLKSGLRGKLV